MKTPEPEHHIEVIKPIVSGNKYGSKRNKSCRRQTFTNAYLL